MVYTYVSHAPRLETRQNIAFSSTSSQIYRLLESTLRPAKRRVRYLEAAKHDKGSTVSVHKLPYLTLPDKNAEAGHHTLASDVLLGTAASFAA